MVEAIVKLRTPVWCWPKALRCLSQLQVDFVQVVVVATHILGIRFGSWELRQVSGTLEVCLPSAGEKVWLPWC
ncbi:hypothetical protein L3X38_016563 [Prunus dulcis]|uniref:Uncharacterized protein n=1 Tax=Prunus dulcis TaxID=3755 RepID=A0AAD4W874_PRUDU|nr:hypothetical protein L3X38_016563 [Prunus dulcis]